MSSDKNDPPKSKETSENIGNEAISEAAISLLGNIINGGSTQARKRRLGEASVNLGVVPIFPDERDLCSADRAYSMVLLLLGDEGINGNAFDWLKSELVVLSQRYWVEYERDTRATYSDMKDEVVQLQKGLAKIIRHLSKISLAAREALDCNARAFRLKRSGPAPNPVEELKNNAELLHEACLPISSKNHRKPRRSYRFEKCGADLWTLREKITGTAVPRTFELRGGAFTTTDAAFIDVVMKAIDERVTASQVRRRHGPRVPLPS